MRSTSPPIVSRPSDSGITSSSSSCCPTALPASWCAWMAAPRATTWSGSRSVSGGWPKNAATAACTIGMRVEPPTRTTPLTSPRPALASRSTLRTAATVRASRSAVSASKRARSTRTDSSPPASGQASVAWSAPLSFSLAARAATSTARLSSAVSACAAGLGERPVGEAVVEVVAAERRVAAGGDDLEHARRQAQQRDVEGAAAEVVDGVEALGAAFEAVGHRRGGRLVDEAQHVQAGELRGVLRRLALRVVEVGRHGDDGAVHVVVEAVLGALAQRGEDLGRHLDRRLVAGDGAQLEHAGRVDEVVGQLGAVGDVGHRAAHEALHRDDGVPRVERRMRRAPRRRSGGRPPASGGR